MKTLFYLVLMLMFFGEVKAQETQLSWKAAQKQKGEWYSSPEARRIADNLLVYQHKTGGWPKNIDMAVKLTSNDIDEILSEKQNSKKHLGQPTMDNGATSTQLWFLAKMYKSTGNENYKKSVLKGIEYLLDSQYESGGWPQFYPIRKGYYQHITYNDNAMVNTMNFLKDLMSDSNEFATLELGAPLLKRIEKAYEKGIDCILKTQIIVNGKPTVWCAQHNRNNFAPAKARAYELPSYSGAESVGIVSLLMEIQHPSPEIIAAVNGAISWFEEHKIEGIRVERFRNNGEKDKRVIADNEAPAIWARFYDLDTGEPFFCDRDGIKKKTLAEIGIERRGGYRWYTDSPQKVLNSYPGWKKKWGVK
ncbi:pectate lyase [uncultured Draconibacterium sp.]|uniref:pectate lyase n=1 Tax=uncultured Draconibacterium sp. TaxID=1573823 RepID=UPI0025D18532|nr:pectate lyase [uncultured Draconibacterium sp.]